MRISNYRVNGQMNKSIIFRRNLFLCLMFFFSGLCGLLYETVWLRLAFAQFGVITPVVSIVVSIFMAGLGLGSWLGGKYIAGFRQKFKVSAIIIYGLIEITIGLGALLVPWLFKQTAAYLLVAGDMDSWTYLLSSSLGIGISILPWAFAMGATYPAVLEFLREFDDQDERQFGRLYAANTAGAVTGVLLTVFVLVEILGFRRTLVVAALINFLIGLMAILWGKQRYKVDQSIKAQKFVNQSMANCQPLSDNDIGTRKVGLLILFTTGFCLMAMEIAWVRAFAPFLGSLVYSFATLLVIYLLSNWFGAYLYRMNLANNQIKSKSILIVVLAISSCLPLLTANYEFSSFVGDHLGTAFARTILLVIPVGMFSVLLGYLTPLLIDDISRGSPAEAGRAYAMNILGCILGPLISGYFLLPMFGARIALVLLTLPLLALILINDHLGINIKARIKSLAAIVIAVIFLASMLCSTWEEGGLWLVRGEEKPRIYRDYTATTIALTKDGSKALVVNGSELTRLSYVVKLMAHLPMAMLQSPAQSVLVICFGMGTTFRSALSWPVKVTAVELLPSVKEAFGYFHSDAQQVLANPNGRIIIDDGRRFLRRSTEKFDVITIDPPPPIGTASSSLLYSTEFFQLIKEHLRTGGILQEWYFPASNKLVCEALARSLAKSFPYVKVFGSAGAQSVGYFFLASERPIKALSVDQFLARLPKKAKVDLAEEFLSANGSEEEKNTISQIFSSEADVSSILVPNKALIITDDHPLNEYFFLRELIGKQVYLTDNWLSFH